MKLIKNLSKKTKGDLPVKSFREYLIKTCKEEAKHKKSFLDDYVSLWARQSPLSTAIVESPLSQNEDGSWPEYNKVSWIKFEAMVNLYALRLRLSGIKKGDVVCGLVPFSKETIFLQFACFRVGAVFAPLDLRLSDEEILHCLKSSKPKAFFFLGSTPRKDFAPIVTTAVKNYRDQVGKSLLLVQMQKNEEGLIEGSISMKKWLLGRPAFNDFNFILDRPKRKTTDTALIIFTSGSTGKPKAAKLSHETIILQTIFQCAAFRSEVKERILVNLPPSHIGGQGQQLMAGIYKGFTSVVIPVFDAKASLHAIDKHKINIIGQIPAMYNLQWNLPEYGSFDLSSLKYMYYGGQSVDSLFLDKLSAVAKKNGAKIITALGMTEAGGAAIITEPTDDVELMKDGYIGYISPFLSAKVVFDKAIDPEGNAGELLLKGPQVFNGYMDEDANKKSFEGLHYKTGDIVRSWDEGEEYFYVSRGKFVIKPKGYQIVPNEIEDFFVSKGNKLNINRAFAVGIKDPVYSEKIVLFVEKSEDKVEIKEEDLIKLAEGLTAYKRPTHYHVVNKGEVPLNRTAKVDYLALQKIGEGLFGE